MELLTDTFHAEINALTQLLAKYTNLPSLFDAPEATIPQRTACFALLAHRKLIETIDDTFAGSYENSPSLGDVESDTIKRTHNLVAADAPAWVLEMHQVVERLPTHIFNSLPTPLRMGGYNPDNAEQMQAIESAKKTLGNVEQIQALIERVLDQQLQRLSRRWSASIPPLPTEPSGVTKAENRPRGFEGLSRKKLDLSRYLDNLTEKQRTAFSLKHEYGLGLAEVASRMGLDRKTAYEHIQAASRRIDQFRSGEKHKLNRAKTSPEE